MPTHAEGRRPRGPRIHPSRMIGVANGDDEWRRKGATLSGKRARKEFGLTQEEILEAIDAGKLTHRISVIHGNPCSGSCGDRSRS